MKITGIYCFTNKENGKKYVGQSIDVQERIKQHQYRCGIPNDSGYNTVFHAALRKYGLKNFSVEILEECEIAALDERERYWIQKLNSLTPQGYNVLEGGQNHRQSSKHICPICGKTKEIYSEYCAECWKNIRESTALLPLDQVNLELVDKILSTSFEQVARDLGYHSGNSLKKRLVAAGFPSTRETLLQYYLKETGQEHISEIQKRAKEQMRQIHSAQRAPKIVEQYDSSNNLIAIFSSTQEAYRKTGVHSGHISDCCRGKRKQAGGFIWKYQK